MNTRSASRTNAHWAGLALGVVLTFPGSAGAAHLAEEPAASPAAAPEGLIAPVLEVPRTLVYPPELAASEQAPAGTIIVAFVVATDGSTKEASIVQSLHPELDAAALAAVAELRYRPATYGGNAVEVSLQMAIEVTPPPRPAVAPPPEVTPAAPADAVPEPAVAPGPVRIRGTVREAGQRTPLGAAIVTAMPAGDLPLGKVAYRKRRPPSEAPAWTVQSTTDDAGRFTLTGVPDGRTRVAILTPGFERLDYVLDVRGGEVTEVTWFQVRMNTNPYRTEVLTEAETMPEITRHAVEREEIQRIPGTNGDALRSVQNLPGMARAPFGGGDLIIRGAAPGDSVVYLGGHEIPALFHFGGLTSVFNSDLVARIDYLPGNFDGRYGDATGGAVAVTTRRGRRDGHHGAVDVDVFDAGALVEGPVGKGSFALSARRSYIDAILPAILPKDGGLRFTAAPRYWDYQAQLDYPLWGGTLTARVFGSDDRTVLLFAEQNEDGDDLRSQFETRQWFHRADLAYERKWGRWSAMISPSYRRDSFQQRVVEIFDFDIVTDRLSVRGEVARTVGKRSEFRVGTELVNDWISADVASPPPPGDTTGGRGGGNAVAGGVNDQLIRKVDDYRGRPALYGSFRIGLHDRVTLTPSVRLTYYSAPTNRVAFEPRLRFEADATKTTRITAGAGIFSQGPQLVQNDAVFGNPDLKPEHAVHTSIGVEQKFRGDWSISGTGFYKHLWSLVSTSPDEIERGGQRVPERYDNAGVGRIYGGEFMVRKALGGKLFGWVSYTISRSEVQGRPGQSWALFDYDQTHILTLIASYKLPRNWQIGARFRLASGNPTTPVAHGVTQLYDGVGLALPGPYNGDRMRTFHQLDLRIDKTWTMRRVRLHTYLDIQNVYNAKNPEMRIYSWNFQKSTSINSLPIIPSIGLKLEW